MSRIERMKVAVRCRAAKELSRGSSYKPIQENKMVAPLGSFDERGKFKYSDTLSPSPCWVLFFAGVGGLAAVRLP